MVGNKVSCNIIMMNTNLYISLLKDNIELWLFSGFNVENTTIVKFK